MPDRNRNQETPSPNSVDTGTLWAKKAVNRLDPIGFSRSFGGERELQDSLSKGSRHVVINLEIVQEKSTKQVIHFKMFDCRLLG